jgi:hypothetical protein
MDKLKALHTPLPTGTSSRSRTKRRITARLVAGELRQGPEHSLQVEKLHVKTRHKSVQETRCRAQAWPR